MAEQYGMKLFTERKAYPYKIVQPSDEVEIIYKDICDSEQRNNNIKGYFYDVLDHFEKYNSIRQEDLNKNNGEEGGD